MRYTDYKGESLSLLGFGTMRLPVKEDRSIDEELTQQMTDCLIENGVNYFDLAYPYMDGKSEIVMGKCLSVHDRKKIYIADKFPGHQHFLPLTPEEVFEEQLEKVGVDYFDFYLLHNVNDSSVDHYMDPEAGIIRYFREQKEAGRIRHLGFSTHASQKCLEQFVAFCEENGIEMEFCQIQLNYLDWTLQKAKEKVEFLNAHRIPVWVMEPVRGGKLADLPEKAEKRLSALERKETDAAWAFQFAAGVPGVQMILSGMSTMEQVRENLATFNRLTDLSAEEKDVLFAIAEDLKEAVPCTACRYCTDACPVGIEIPLMIQLYNEIRFQPTFQPGMVVAGIPEGKKPWDCLSCGACASMCPQNISIPEILKDLTERLKNAPDWVEICREREEIRRRSLK